MKLGRKPEEGEEEGEIELTFGQQYSVTKQKKPFSQDPASQC